MKKLALCFLIASGVSCSSVPKQASNEHSDSKRRGVAVSDGELHRYEQRDPKEEVYTKVLVAAFTAKVAASKEKLRGTHSKGICTQGSFEVYDIQKSEVIPREVSARLAQGFFARPGTWDTRIRFANAEGAIRSDEIFDPRAISLSVKLNAESRQDFVLQNSPIFPIPSLRDFVLVVLKGDPQKALAITELKPAEMKTRLMRVGSLVGTFPKTVDSYLTQKYWSGSSFALGSEDAVKYVLTPCGANSKIAKSAPGPDFLKETVRDHVLSGQKNMACFEFGIQILNPETLVDAEGKKHPANEWVEDVGLEWKTNDIYPAGQLTLKSDALIDDSECDDPKNVVNVVKYSFPENRAIGQINRGREAPEQASARARSK